MAWTKEQRAMRTARELQDGYYVNLGLGLPTTVSNYVPKGMLVWLHSENGLLGLGPFPTETEVDPDMINASKQTVTAVKGASVFPSYTSFGMVRSGKIDLTILGAMQISAQGDIANWMVPGKMVKGMGGAMDMVTGVKRVVVMMNHTQRHADGREEPKILNKCTLPLTGARVVERIITEMGVMDVTPCGLRLVEIADGETFDSVQAKTEAPLLCDELMVA